MQAPALNKPPVAGHNAPPDHLAPVYAQFPLEVVDAEASSSTRPMVDAYWTCMAVMPLQRWAMVIRAGSRR